MIYLHFCDLPSLHWSNHDVHFNLSASLEREFHAETVFKSWGFLSFIICWKLVRICFHVRCDSSWVEFLSRWKNMEFHWKNSNHAVWWYVCSSVRLSEGSFFYSFTGLQNANSTLIAFQQVNWVFASFVKALKILEMY